MLCVLQVFLLALTLANGLPAATVQSEQEILNNDIENNDFTKELPFEAEYYRTSTDRDEFVRPIPNPNENEIDDGDGGIDLDEPNTFTHTPECTYNITIKLFYESIDDLEVNLEGLKVKNGAKNQISLDNFVQQVQLQIFNTIKGKNFTNELVNDMITYIRQTFASVYGYEDNCGVSTTAITYFTKNDTQVDSPQSNDEATNAPPREVNIETETEMSSTETTPNDDEDDVTEEYHSRNLTRPKLSTIIQDTIDVYRALNNWKYPKQS